MNISKKEEKLNLRDFFHLSPESVTEESSESKAFIQAFSSSSEVQSFFMKVGQSLRDCPLEPETPLTTLT